MAKKKRTPPPPGETSTPATPSKPKKKRVTLPDDTSPAPPPTKSKKKHVTPPTSAPRRVSTFQIPPKNRASLSAASSDSSTSASTTLPPSNVSTINIIQEDSIPRIPITGKETEQDLVEIYNEYYRHHKQTTKKGVLAGDSVSSIAINHSQLMESRHCRLVIFRRGLILCSLLLWGCSVVFLGFWFGIMYIWPRHFTLTTYAKEHYSVNIVEASISFSILGITVLHCGLVGGWGLICASCGQNRCLHRFMLTAPWFLLISISCGFLAVKFVGDLSQLTLVKTLADAQGFYYHARNIYVNESQAGWDTAQLYLRCCGIDSAREWVQVNDDQNQTIKVPRSCCMNSRGRHETNKTLLDLCERDITFANTFPVGCKEKIYDFATLIGAAVTGTCFSVTFLIILAVIFAHKFYVVKKKIRIGHFNYPLTEFLIDFFYLRKCIGCYRRRRRRNRDPDELSLDEYDLYNAMEEAVNQEEKEMEAYEHEGYLGGRRGSRKKSVDFFKGTNNLASKGHKKNVYKNISSASLGRPRKFSVMSDK